MNLELIRLWQMKIAALACVVLATGSAALSATSPSSPDLRSATAVAEDFYAAYSTFDPSDGIPDAKGRAKIEPYISPVLENLLVQGEAAERHFKAATKNMSPPLIEGDLFTSNFEGATSYHVGTCKIDASTARCTVALGYRSGPEDSKPINWSDTIWLVRGPAGWKIDDIAYGGSWDFGNKGRLQETLQSAIRDGNGAAQ